MQTLTSAPAAAAPPGLPARRRSRPPELLAVLRMVTAFQFLYLSAAGAGPWSLDALRRSR